MLEPPALSEAALIAALRDGYGLEASAVTFLPLGYDAAAAVYRVAAAGRAYFLKVRGEAVNPASLALPRYLADRGLAPVPAPLRTRAQTLWHPLDGYGLSLYPFIEDSRPLPSGSAEAQWVHFGATMRQVHETVLPPALAALIGRETFTPLGKDLVVTLDARVSGETFEDPLAQDLAAFWRARQGAIRALVERAEALGQRLRQADNGARVLCHADIHWDNVLLDAHDQLWLVDWDETCLSLKERDLMFVIGGITADWGTPRDTALFLRGYGLAEVNEAALAYYRTDWALQDTGDFARQVLAEPPGGEATRRDAARLFKGLFEMGGIVEKALGTA